MLELSYPSILLVLTILGFAGFVHGTLGVGFPLTATPLLALFMDVQTAILITLFPNIVVNILSIIKGGNWSQSIGRYWPLAIYASIGSMIGTEILITAPPEPFKLLLAILIIIYLNTSRLSRIKLDWIGTQRHFSMAVFGLVAGLMGGTTNVMLPILVIFALELGLATTVMIQVFNLCFMMGKITQVGVFSLEGLLDVGLLFATIPAVIVSAVILLIGMRLRDRIKTETYRRFLNYLLVITSVILIMQFTNSLTI